MNGRRRSLREGPAASPRAAKGRARLTGRSWLALACCLAVGCGDDSSPPETAEDAGADAAADVVDAVPDAVDVVRTIPDDWDVTPPDVDEVDVPADTPPDATVWPDEPLTEQNAWGPAGRVVRMEMPSGPAEARSEGCLVYGEKVGTGLNSLLVLAGGLDQFTAPNADGLIEVLLYARAAGWEPGQRPEDLDHVDLEIYFGHPDPSDGWLIAPGSFLEENPELGPVVSYRDSAVQDGWLSSTSGLFSVKFGLLGLSIHLKLESARLAGRMYADGPGMGLRRGVLTGYITQPGALDLLHGIQDSCTGEGRADICGAVENFIGLGQPDEDLIELAGNFIGGYDARMDEGGPSDCGGDVECNAVSVCILMDVDGIEIAGVAP